MRRALLVENRLQETRNRACAFFFEAVRRAFSSPRLYFRFFSPKRIPVLHFLLACISIGAKVALHKLKEVRTRSRGFFFSRISGLLLAATPHAQINEGTIIGTVQDAAGAAVRSQIQ